jgi:UPF0755 protein
LSEEKEKPRGRRREAQKDSATAPQPMDVGTVPEARRRRSATSRVFYSLFVMLAIAAVAVVGMAAFGYQQYIGAGPLVAPKVVEVRKGLSTPEIGDDLENAGVISDAKVFSSAVYLTGSRGRLKAGEYEFAAGMSMRDVLGLIVQGKSIVYKLTIPEGWTTEQALQRVRENQILTGELTVSPPEGGIFPDTYVFKRGATRDSVVTDMMEARQKLVDELWQKRAPDLVVKSPNEALTLASIVEKETAKPEERSRVAAVFTNRLKQRMRLQSDPTIIYGLVGGRGKLDRPLTKQDIATKTPYNTYRIDGLPPGPIANPGRAALEAVLNPPVTNELYFVADGTGGHVFAETLADHRKNVAKWREIERQQNTGDGEVVDELAAEKTAEIKTERSPEPQQPQPVKPEQMSSTIPAPPLPEGTAVTEATGSTAADSAEKIVIPELPQVEDQPSAADGSKTAAADPKITDQKVSIPPKAVEPASEPVEKPVVQQEKQQVPAPVAKSEVESKSETTSEVEPKPEPTSSAVTEQSAGSIPKKTEEVAAVAVQTAAVPLPRAKPRQMPKPGDLIKVADRLVPIPIPKPKPQ